MKKILFISILVLIPVIAFAAIIELENGTLVEGSIVERTDDYIVVDIDRETNWKMELFSIEHIYEEDHNDFRVEGDVFRSAYKEVSEFDDPEEWLKIIKNPQMDLYKKASAAKLLGEETTISYERFYVTGKALDAVSIMEGLKNAALHDGNLLVNIEAAWAWLEWSGSKKGGALLDGCEAIVPVLVQGAVDPEPFVRERSTEICRHFYALDVHEDEQLKCGELLLTMLIAEFQKEERKPQRLRLASLILQTHEGMYQSDSPFADQIGKIINWVFSTGNESYCHAIFERHGRWLIYPDSIPFLIEFLSSQKENMSTFAAYQLRKITGLMPFEHAGKDIDVHGLREIVIEKLKQGYRNKEFSSYREPPEPKTYRGRPMFHDPGPLPLDAFLLGAELGIKEAGIALREDRLNKEMYEVGLMKCIEIFLKLDMKVPSGEIVNAFDQLNGLLDQMIPELASALLKYDENIAEEIKQYLQKDQAKNKELATVILAEIDKSSGKVTDATIFADEEWAKKILRSLSTACEAYARSKGQYPNSIEDLTSEQPPYFYDDKKYCEEVIDGYQFSCEFGKDGYRIVAKPVQKGKAYQVTTMGVLGEVDESHLENKIRSRQPYKKYYKSGQLRDEVTQEGLHKTYYENGQLKLEAAYKEGQIDGIVKYYYENGQLSQEETYKNGKREGLRKSYHRTGQLSDEAYFKNGKPEGVSRGYYSNGQLESETFYKDGNRVFELEKWYHENGQLRSETTPEGVQKHYYENGQLLEIKTPEGLKKRYYPSGELSSEKLPNGLYREYSITGELERSMMIK